jgi:hypothetical protein
VEVGLLFGSLVETLQSSFPFGGDSPFDLGIRPGMAMGLQRSIRTLLAFIGGGHPDYVDDLLFR